MTGPATVRFQDAAGSPDADATVPAPEPTEPAPTDTAAPPPADTALLLNFPQKPRLRCRQLTNPPIRR